MRNKNTTSLKFRSTGKPGFTLIELLVVIAIIGLLASIVLLALNGARQKSRDATRIADVREMASAFELFYNDASSYPTNSTAGTAVILGTAPMASGNYTFTPNYVGTLPAAPTPFDSSGIVGQSCTAATNAFMYATPNGNGNWYTLTFCLGATTGGYAPGPHTLTPAGIQ